MQSIRSVQLPFVGRMRPGNLALGHRLELDDRRRSPAGPANEQASEIRDQHIAVLRYQIAWVAVARVTVSADQHDPVFADTLAQAQGQELGRASCRERACQ